MKKGNKQVLEAAPNEVKTVTDMNVKSSQGTSDDAVQVCDPGFLTFVRTCMFQYNGMTIVIKKNDVELSAKDILTTVEHYTCLLLSLKKQQQELLDLTKAILSCNQKSV